MLKYPVIILIILFAINIISADTYSDCSVYGNCQDKSGTDIITGGNYTINTNNSDYLQGLTPQQVANLYSETDPNYFSNPRNYYNSSTLPSSETNWTYANNTYLKLDQSTPQTITNGTPTFPSLYVDDPASTANYTVGFKNMSGGVKYPIITPMGSTGYSYGIIEGGMYLIDTASVPLPQLYFGHISGAGDWENGASIYSNTNSATEGGSLRFYAKAIADPFTYPDYYFQNGNGAGLGRMDLDNLKLDNVGGINIAYPYVSDEEYTTAWGLKIGDVDWGSTNYAIQTGTGLVEFGDTLRLTKNIKDITLAVAPFSGYPYTAIFQNDGASEYGLVFSGMGDNQYGLWNNFVKSRSIDGVTHKTVEVYDDLGMITWSGDDGTAMTTAGYYGMVVSGAPSSDDVPADWVWWATASQNEIMRLTGDGNLLLSNPSSTTQVKIKATDGGTPASGGLIVHDGANYAIYQGPATIEGYVPDANGDWTAWGDLYLQSYSSGNLFLTTSGRTIVGSGAEDGVTKFQIPAGSGTADNWYINPARLGNVIGGLVNDGAGYSTIQFGINAEQLGTRDYTKTGGLFRFDMRPGFFFGIIRQPADESFSEYLPFSITPYDSTLVGSGWTAYPYGTMYGNDLQVYNGATIGNRLDVVASTTLGTEKLTNGNFTGSATGWTLGSSWHYVSNAVKKDSAGIETLSQAFSAMATAPVVGETYTLTYTISSVTAGIATVTPVCGSWTGFPDWSAPTVGGSPLTYTFTFTLTDVTSYPYLVFTPSDSTARFTIDTISLKKVSNNGGSTYTGNLYASDNITASYEAITKAVSTANTYVNTNLLENSYTNTQSIVATPGAETVNGVYNKIIFHPSVITQQAGGYGGASYNIYGTNNEVYGTDTGTYNAATSLVFNWFGSSNLVTPGGGTSKTGTQTFNVYGAKNTANIDNRLIIDGATATTNVYGKYIAATNSPTFTNGSLTANTYGLYIQEAKGGSSGTSNGYGIYINDVSGSDNNYAIYDVSGKNWVMLSDIAKQIFGAGSDASIYYDGTDMIINPKEVGTGNLKILSGINQTLGNATINMIYGEIYNKSDTGFETVDLVTQDVYVPVKNLVSTGNINGFKTAGGNLTAQVSGMYKATAKVGVLASSTAGDNGMKIFINNNGQDNCYDHEHTSTTVPIVFPIDCLIRINTGDNVSIRFDDHNNPVGDLILLNGNLNLLRVGN